MSKPFAALVSDLVHKRTDGELMEHSFNLFSKWAMLSSSKQVSLEEVAWVGALLVKSAKSAGVDLMAKHETRDVNGARVVGIVASDGVSVADGAG